MEANEEANREAVKLWRVYRTTLQMVKDRVHLPAHCLDHQQL
jgi:hypothetical protein